MSDKYEKAAMWLIGKTKNHILMSDREFQKLKKESEKRFNL